jgi:hypothetical protein
MSCLYVLLICLAYMSCFYVLLICLAYMSCLYVLLICLAYISEQVRHLVLDEADRLLETGNLKTIMNIYSRLNTSRTGTDRLQVNPNH